MNYSYDYRQAAEDDAYWKSLVQSEEREIQNIKKRLKQYHGGVFDEYLGLGSEQANKLRKALEIHRVALGFAMSRKKPTKADINEALSKLSPAVQKAKV
jgi:ribosomal protein L10